MSLHVWQSKWAPIMSELGLLRGLYRSAPRRSAMPQPGMSTTAITALFQHLFHFAEALGADKSVDEAIRKKALRLQQRPKTGPIARCGLITNSDKHAGKDLTKTFAVLVPVTQQTGGALWSTTEQSVRVEYIDPQGVESHEDALALAEQAFQTWHTFLISNGLSAS